MNRGLFEKAVREALPATLLLGAGLFAFEAVLAVVLPSYYDELASHLLELPFVQNILRALLGAEIDKNFGPVAFSSIAWVHPVALTMIWAQEIIFCTRMPAGEIDRGTADLLLTLPVSRWRAYVTDSAVWMLSGVLLMILGFAGSLSGRLVTAAGTPEPAVGRLLIVVLNLYCLYLAVGGLSYFASAWSERRGKAMALVFGIVVTSFFLNFLAQFWKPARSISFLGVLHYYRPLGVLETGSWPAIDMVILAGTGAILWGAGAFVFSRRDIVTL